MDAFQEGYDYFAKNAGAANAAFAGQAYVDGVQGAIDNLTNDLNSFKGFQTASDKLKGDVAEFWHSGTFNIDAAVKGSSHRTFVDRSHGFASADITSNFGDSFGLKYDASAAKTAGEQAMSYFERYRRFAANRMKQGNPVPSFEDFLFERDANPSDPQSPIYGGQGRIVPTDQLNDIRNWLQRKILEEETKRPEMVKRYQDTLDRLNDCVRDAEGNSSTPLSNDLAKQIADVAKEGEFDPASLGLTTEELIKYEYVLQQALKAGMTAATITLVLKVAPEIIKAIQYLVEDGELDEHQFQKIGFAALSGSAEGFVRGSVAATLTTACTAGLLGESLKTVSPPVIGTITVIVLDAIKSSYAVAGGKQSRVDAANKLVQEMFVSSCSLVAGSIVQGILVELPAFGFMLGSFVGSVVGSFVYKTGYNATLSFCIDSGFTMFGLVEQNYELPERVMEEIGFEVFTYDQFSQDAFEVPQFETPRFEIDRFEPDDFGITFLRRGVIGIHKIGYV